MFEIIVRKDYYGENPFEGKIYDNRSDAYDDICSVKDGLNKFVIVNRKYSDFELNYIAYHG